MLNSILWDKRKEDPKKLERRHRWGDPEKGTRRRNIYGQRDV